MPAEGRKSLPHYRLVLPPELVCFPSAIRRLCSFTPTSFLHLYYYIVYTFAIISCYLNCIRAMRSMSASKRAWNEMRKPRQVRAERSNIWGIVSGVSRRHRFADGGSSLAQPETPCSGQTLRKLFVRSSVCTVYGGRRRGQVIHSLHKRYLHARSYRIERSRHLAAERLEVGDSCFTENCVSPKRSRLTLSRQA